MNPTLEILEIDYSVSPGGVNSFEVYDANYPSNPLVFESANLTDAVEYCYNLGQDFTVRTLATYYAQEALNV